VGRTLEIAKLKSIIR